MEGCNVNQLGREGNTALHYACYNDHQDCIMYLISLVIDFCLP